MTGASDGWHGTVHTAAGEAAADAQVHLKKGSSTWDAKTDAQGAFQFSSLKQGVYIVSIDWRGQHLVSEQEITLPSSESANLTLSAHGVLAVSGEGKAGTGAGGEQLS
ncbi:MAG TPA: carboxypeptidase regulatory-like domain-containing protein, partial [Candidatus Angelobacter sp.]|nr:carboxypeptidase regulatory-like domain-containing protein [Candidatus Angelobacter sp.]